MVEGYIRGRWKPGDVFTTTQIYEGIPEFLADRLKTPHVPARILQALQTLRGNERIHFITRGTYRLLK